MSGYAAVPLLLSASPRPQAIFAANDMMAVGCIQSLRDAGLRVPDDIAVTGFDDMPVARYLSPPLTTVRAQITEWGQQSPEMLAEVIAGRLPCHGQPRIS